MHWRHSFVGREDDLKILRDAYEEAQSGMPRVVALVAESGFGKTRLAQEFYNWLSTNHDGVGGAGYWPDFLLREEDNLRVNPDLDECGGDGHPMPFLWWGLRLADPGQRNAVQGSGALLTGLDNLKPHLGAYEREIMRADLKRRQITGGRGAAADLALGIGETALEVLANFGTFGTLGLAKTIGAVTLGHRKATRDIEALDGLDVRPGAAEKRGRDDLAETVIGDLHRLCKAPPKGFEAIPLVVLVDDAQWLASDGGMASFLDLLLQRARAESWPILLVMTSWRREWQVSAAAEEGPGVFAQLDRGDVVYDLGGVAGLETVIRAAYPGLTAEQVDQLSQKAEGTPRLLDEMLMYLDRRQKAFVGRDKAGPLTEAGLVDVLEKDFAGFVADRLGEAPEHVRRALAIASMQGVGFSPRLVHRVAEGLTLVGSEVGLSEGENPHSFVVGSKDQLGAEFRLRAYRDAALDELGNLFDEVEVGECLKAALMDVARTPTEATDRELALVLNGAALLQIEGSEWNAIAIEAGAEMIQRARAVFDTRAAGIIAEQILPLFPSKGVADNSLVIWRACDAAIAWFGPRRTEVEILRHTAEALRCINVASPGPGARRDVAIALGRLGDVVEALDGPGAARPLFEEMEQIHRALAEEQPSPGARRELAAGLGRLGDVVEALDGPAAAQLLRKEMVELMRALAEKQPSPGARRDLAVALGSLGDVVEALDGPATARPLFEETEQIYRALAEEQPSPNVRRELAAALVRLGSVVEVLDSPAAARPLFEETVESLSALAKEQPSSGARRDLAVALGSLGNVVEALDGPAAARSFREEGERIHRALAEEQPSPNARRDLAFALGKLGKVVGALDGAAAARPIYEEMVELTRALVREQPNPGVRRELAAALSKLGDVVEALNGPDAARPLFEEIVDNLRTLVEEQPNPGARRELAVVLGRLGDVVEALDGPAAARPIREEMVELMRSYCLLQPYARPELIYCLTLLLKTLEMVGDKEAVQSVEEEIFKRQRV